VSLPQNLGTRPTARHEMLYRVGDELRFDRLNENLVGLVFTLLSVVVHARKSVTCSHHCDSPDKRSLMKGEILHGSGGLKGIGRCSREAFHADQLPPTLRRPGWWPNDADWLYVACPGCRLISPHIGYTPQHFQDAQSVPHGDKSWLCKSLRCAAEGCRIPVQFHEPMEPIVTLTTEREFARKARKRILERRFARTGIPSPQPVTKKFNLSGIGNTTRLRPESPGVAEYPGSDGFSTLLAHYQRDKDLAGVRSWRDFPPGAVAAAAKGRG
jgi:hypothetical protein